MAMAMPRFVALALLVFAGTLILGNHGVSADCEETITQLVLRCLQYVLPDPGQRAPSSQCCAVLKSADIPCLCSHVTPDVEKIVSMKKVVYVARTCGAHIPQPGTKCGSYTIPPTRKI
ncbi:hypothetical protein Dsin_019164 [Dipteronia sinensis]|uniref:Bifunctional inhibitor/plant lipid transfer protein/seed storage helical domain-containing protein n=1 Tax=Dipteronia sinensis TaxID=43782 RepID=A0AAE0A850_9ROSI|nr:hypothetical protein Dsin_019164 [Dipteronia sinensis]